MLPAALGDGHGNPQTASPKGNGEVGGLKGKGGKKGGLSLGGDAQGLPRSLVEACEGETGAVKPKALFDIVQRSLGESSSSGKAGGGQSEGGSVTVEESAWPLLADIVEHLCLSSLQFAVKLVDHRGGSTIEARDIARYLRTNMQLNVHAPGLEDHRSTSALKRRAQGLPHWELQQEAKRQNAEERTRD
ncbi:hypothetical protein HOP50_02g11760 [Chloropicon primus]|uniref:Transcription initiation factor TFIID subunit 12 domain-containing protein n=1 Tax=Chloropicon primus TaxID=1764295 RepID=A0A5B8ME17_9CHLO|nr:hypothetical protein A3770_02p11910 [Chloropicon primus]UPQ97881.1 hypothetical protein HOP50_02g11760 [Chloropicon primus]|eukprot:QDZ18673.1 hypothetical protein A3770_02p11910 [Chloropicon primus]